jgi:glucose/arabinose dehydrogenase
LAEGTSVRLRSIPLVVVIGAACSTSSSRAQDALRDRLSLPAGFTISEYAKVGGARFMALGPDGAVYVSRPGNNEVVRLVDADRNGEAESQTVAVSGLDRPHGLAFHGGYLYIANTNGVVRVKLGADGKATAAPEQVNSYSGGGGHWSRSIVFGRDSGLYVSIGSTCNMCVERTPDRASVMRFDENGTNGRVFSSGLRNAVGIAVHPTTGQIWVTQNERDNIEPDHEDLPPEEINILQDGGDYGWPYCYGNREPSPDRDFHDPARCQRTIPPALAMQAHSAPLGITFLDRATMFPAEWRGDAVVAFHGSWNRATPTGAKVVRIRVRDGRPVSYEDFITGWQGPNGRRWGRPVDVMVNRDGSLLISDDTAGAIYRVTRAEGR